MYTAISETFHTSGVFLAFWHEPLAHCLKLKTGWWWMRLYYWLQRLSLVDEVAQLSCRWLSVIMWPQLWYFFFFLTKMEFSGSIIKQLFFFFLPVDYRFISSCALAQWPEWWDSHSSQLSYTIQLPLHRWWSCPPPAVSMTATIDYTSDKIRFLGLKLMWCGNSQTEQTHKYKTD